MRSHSEKSKSRSTSKGQGEKMSLLSSSSSQYSSDDDFFLSDKAFAEKTPKSPLIKEQIRVRPCVLNISKNVPDKEPQKEKLKPDLLSKNTLKDNHLATAVNNHSNLAPLPDAVDKIIPTSNKFESNLSKNFNPDNEIQHLDSIFDIPTSEANEPFSSVFDQEISEERDAFVFSIHEEGPHLYLYCKFKADPSQFGTICICIIDPVYFIQFHPNNSLKDNDSKQSENNLQKEVENIINQCKGKVISGEWINIYEYDKSSKRVYEVTLSASTEMSKIPLYGDFYSKVTCASYNLTETFCIKRGIKGNCWIHAHCSQAQHLETTIPMYTAKTINDIEPLNANEKCPFNICSFSLMYTEDQHLQVATLRIFKQWDISNWNIFPGMRNATTNVKTYAVTNDHNALVTTNPQKSGIKYCESEKSLLENIFDAIERNDIDILVSYDLISSDLPFFLRKASELKVQNWNLLGRHNRSIFIPKFRVITAGRILCDIKTSFLHLFGINSSNISDIVMSELKMKRPLVFIPNFSIICNNIIYIRNLIGLNQKDTLLISRLIQKRSLLNCSRIISKITGALWTDVLIDKPSNIFEHFLIMVLKKRNFILPDRYSKPHLFPTFFQFPTFLGVHDDVAFLNIPELIPNIILEYRICFIQAKEPKILPCISNEFLSKIQNFRKTKENEKIYNMEKIAEIGSFSYILRALTSFITNSSNRFNTSSISQVIQEKLHKIFEGLQVLYKNENSFLIQGDVTNFIKNFQRTHKFIKIHHIYDFSRVLIATNESFIGMKNDGKIESKNFILNRKNWCIATQIMGNQLLQAALLNQDPFASFRQFIDSFSSLPTSDLIFNFTLPNYMIKHFFFHQTSRVNLKKIQDFSLLIEDNISKGKCTPIKTTIKYLVGEGNKIVDEELSIKIDRDFYIHHFAQEAKRILDPFPEFNRESFLSLPGIKENNIEIGKFSIECPFCNHHMQVLKGTNCEKCGSKLTQKLFSNLIIQQIHQQIEKFLKDSYRVCDAFLCDYSSSFPKVVELEHSCVANNCQQCKGHLRKQQSWHDFNHMITEMKQQLLELPCDNEQFKKTKIDALEYLNYIQTNNGLQTIKISQLLPNDSS